MAQLDASKAVVELKCASSLVAIRAALRKLESDLTSLSVPAEWVCDLNLVLSEALSNIVRHGNLSPSDEICLELTMEDHALHCKITDHGTAFDPSILGQTAPDPALLPEGGFGWFIIHNLSQTLTYERVNGQNCLRFTIPTESCPH